jgi:hypothetical protein
VVVRGEDGQDEVTLDGTTTAIEVDADGKQQVHQWTASSFGLTSATAADMQANDPAHSAQIIREIFDGKPGPCRDIVIANAAAGLWLVGRCESLLQGARLAAQVIDSGQARHQLRRFAEMTRQNEDQAAQPSTLVSGDQPHSRFSSRAIELAAELKAAGLAWEPQPGHFVYDPQHVLPHTSPFQDRVFFILDISHFLRYAGSYKSLVERMIWLPAWWDARDWLRNAGAEDAAVAETLHRRQSITRCEELVVLYEMILERLG